MIGISELLCHLPTDTLCRAVRFNMSRFFFQLFQFFQKHIEIEVRNFGLVLHIVQVVVTVELSSKKPDAFKSDVVHEQKIIG
ncbi:hypothetical protein SDC9_61478 [bioreactor metagenome]|uniref:Uncharacterized protein n=1 Tax=bioreactor metagenome TaxID=1076179 RepID=A0A644XFW2_9ZZZZ